MTPPPPPPPPQPVRLTISSTPAHLPVVRAALESFCEVAGLNERESGCVVLAVDEALTNVIRHAYHGQHDKPIEVSLATVSQPSGQQTLEIYLRDWGTQVAPEQIRSRDLSDVRPGGLGVHIIRNCMDEVSYCHVPEGGTCLRLTKRITGKASR